MPELDPTEAAELFIEDKASGDVADRTIYTYRQHLRYFTEWLAGRERSVETVRDVTGLTLTQYKAAHPDYAHGTLYNRLRTVREMLRWAASVGAHDRDVVEDIELERPQDVRNGTVEAEAAAEILETMDRYRYASREHVTFLFLWECGCRLGTIRAFDLQDYHAEERYVEAVHRPETDTPLKNNEGGERPISLAPEVSAVVEEYVERRREAVTDDAGREPLLTTANGRPALITLRTTVWSLTQPCWYGRDCPDGLDSDACDAAGSKRGSNGCPHNNSPHDIRRGRLTDYRRRDVPKHVISDRCDVSIPVLEEHYNTMTDEEKMEQRREYL